MSQEKRWLAEEKHMLILSNAYIQKKTLIHGLPPGDDDIGYTVVTNDYTTTPIRPIAEIYVCRLHKYMLPLTEKNKSLFRLGVYTHEALHQIFTDFTATKNILNKLTGKKQRLFKEISNIVEDTRIEYFANQKFGGECLSALQYTIKTVYDSFAGIGNETSPVIQTINALIQLGDVGIIKGKFTFPSAFECFKEVVPYFEAAVTKPVCAEALSLSLNITDIFCKHFPELAEEKDYNESQKRSKDATGRGSGSDAKEETDENGHKKPTKSLKELLDELGINLDEIEQPDDNTETPVSKPSRVLSDDEFELDEEPELIIDEFGFGEEPLDEEEPSPKNPSKKESGENADDELSEINKIIAKAFKENSNPDENSEIEKSADAVDVIIKELIVSMSKEEEKNKADTSIDLSEVPLPNDKYTSCIVNKKMEPNIFEYSSLLSRNKKLIQATTGYIKRFLANNTDEKIRHTNGSINLNRYHDKSYTSIRIFDKRKDTNVNDICIMVLADESGSTSGSKSEAIKDATTIIAESCAALNIPCCVLGFTADEKRDPLKYEAVIRHYTSWKNKKTDRTSIANMRARCNNRDGASIRYAVSLLKKRKEAQKILFVISDGLPIALGYSGEPARKDTKLAIREAKNVCSLTGILVGDSNVEHVHEMYGNDFLLVKNVSTLPAQLSKLFRNSF